MKFGVISLNGRRLERQDSVDAKQEHWPGLVSADQFGYRPWLARLAVSMYNNKRSAEVAQG